MKLSATGNDFILFEKERSGFDGSEAELFRRICRRGAGVGADGILLLQRGHDAPFRVQYFNADGRPSAMCGNGARAAAYYACRVGLAAGEFEFTLGEERLRARVTGEQVAVQMPRVKNVKLEPGVVQEPGFEELGFAVVGVPHYVLRVEHVESVDVQELGRKYRRHAAFAPNGTNVSFVEIIAPGAVRIRTYERGVEAETLACGTGVTATACLLMAHLGWRPPVRFTTRGGKLVVHRGEGDDEFLLEGTVRWIFDGDLHLDAFDIEANTEQP